MNRVQYASKPDRDLYAAIGIKDDDDSSDDSRDEGVSADEGDDTEEWDISLSGPDVDELQPAAADKQRQKRVEAEAHGKDNAW
ncbi:hypothetical protein JG687_00002613 [Phytophthora cactorum]|uniref:Uncharacterized protein n=1 Tax=Phytophthora cactorum TaxID=29920 RepID=A0A329SKC5_9STRA|nr:hypothetical protein Pcac1_g4049 [Phytophthora cactorum]KAG2839633.1 hypothetical protein PC112_g4067 [Phytophthora cactorum]KAG2844017.1 hypothetical protein PC111_g2126 [Phytophthora cactorum]KAG2865949.1 hypothetical protein PC113_g3263 [Phytophthora cactorum]KAG2928188.1 hypothetical protein PC114_g3243 [Phytophthora cactorum]